MHFIFYTSTEYSVILSALTLSEENKTGSDNDTAVCMSLYLMKFAHRCWSSRWSCLETVWTEYSAVEIKLALVCLSEAQNTNHSPNMKRFRGRFCFSRWWKHPSIPTQRRVQTNARDLHQKGCNSLTLL